MWQLFFELLIISWSLFIVKDKDTDKVGSVAIAEMLDRTNLIAIVSGGNYPIIAPNSGKLFLTIFFLFKLDFK